MEKKLKKKTFDMNGVRFVIDPKKDTVTVAIGKAKKEVKMIDLWSVAFHISSTDLKDKIMPVRQTEMMKFKKVHRVQLKNDMKAGETLTFACIIDVPLAMKEGLANPIEEQSE